MHPEIAKARAIAQIIGSPFKNTERQIFSDLPFSVSELYGIAQKNKIGLYFLESLARTGSLGELEEQLNRERRNYHLLRQTIERAAGILNTSGAVYAVIKSIMPFPAVPNDVDILIFGQALEYRTIVRRMKENGFQILGVAPLEVCMHDGLQGLHEDVSTKDPSDVDLYSEIGASHIIYMDKNKLADRLEETVVNATTVKVMSTPAEMALSIFHSIFPERIYTLLLHFYILHTIEKLNSNGVSQFLEIVQTHKIKHAVSQILELTEKLHHVFFGDVPDKLTDLRIAVGSKTSSLEPMMIPYHYPLDLILRSFWHKRHDLTFSISLTRQTVSMINPRMMKHVYTEYVKRSKRGTY
jgi:hypothetical protein